MRIENSESFLNILFCCEFYAPSIGGVQEVMKQIAEHLVLRGHDVTVATKKLPARNIDNLNGVRIVEFDITGNFSYGMIGEIESYQHFVTSNNFDVIMIKAAQQWTFDALWPVLNQISAPKVFIPCGFSGLYDPVFSSYFHELPNILRQFDHLIFYASDYRDINFTKKHGINNFSLIPNGASEIEFSIEPDPLFREKHGIGQDDLLLLTVGSFTGSKGHFEVVSAFEKLKTKKPSTLILNGNIPEFLSTLDRDSEALPQLDTKSELSIPFLQKLLTAIRKGTIFKLVIGKIRYYIVRLLKLLGIIQERTYQSIAQDINEQQGNKKVIITDLPRPDLIQAFLAADLFVFASLIEYSPLVLFEAAAAGTPFLSVPVGNAAEIARWTEAGQICRASQDKCGNTKVKPAVFARHLAKLIKNKPLLYSMGQNGKKNWEEKFTWAIISEHYETIFRSLISKGSLSH